MTDMSIEHPRKKKNRQNNSGLWAPHLRELCREQQRTWVQRFVREVSHRPGATGKPQNEYRIQNKNITERCCLAGFERLDKKLLYPWDGSAHPIV